MQHVTLYSITKKELLNYNCSKTFWYQSIASFPGYSALIDHPKPSKLNGINSPTVGYSLEI